MVCTAQRPKMLRNCLISLMAQEVSDDWSVEICVVENDSIPASKQTVDELNSSSPFKIHYAQEPKRGIPYARNKTLAMALGNAYDWILLIDDDEIARKNWLSNHLKTAITFGADVSYGLIEQVYEKPLPTWASHETPSDKEEGALLTRASTNNVLFRTALLRPPACLKFNTALTYGYEDLDFFETAAEYGFKIVWAPNAIVQEYVPKSRVTPERILAFAKSSAAAHVQVGIMRKGYWQVFPKFLFKGLRRVSGAAILAAATYPAAKLGSEPFEILHFRGRLRLARGLGNLLGIFGRPPSYYSTIDGF